MGRRRRARRERQLLKVQLIEWWRPRAAFNERLAVLTDELRAESPPEAFAAAIDEIRRLQPLFEGCPDPVLGELNSMRRDLLIRAFTLAEGGELVAAAEWLDQLTVVTDQAVARMELLLDV